MTYVALGAGLSFVPEMVMAGPPGTTVWLPITNPPAEFAVIVCPAIFSTIGIVLLAIGTVLIPIMSAVAPGARLITVPETVMAGPLGLSVWPPATKLPAE